MINLTNSYSRITASGVLQVLFISCQRWPRASYEVLAAEALVLLKYTLRLFHVLSSCPNIALPLQREGPVLPSSHAKMRAPLLNACCLWCLLDTLMSQFNPLNGRKLSAFHSGFLFPAGLAG